MRQVDNVASGISEVHTVRIVMMIQPLALTFICLCPVFIHSECDFKKTKKNSLGLKLHVLGLSPRLKYLKSL